MPPSIESLDKQRDRFTLKHLRKTYMFGFECKSEG